MGLILTDEYIDLAFIVFVNYTKICLLYFSVKYVKQIAHGQVIYKGGQTKFYLVSFS